jgi:hypothetical protein
MTTDSLDVYADELRDELLDLLRATAMLSDDDGPRPHVWAQIEAAITDPERRGRVPVSITAARRRRARRSVGRVTAIAAAITLLGGIAYAGLAPSSDEDRAVAPTTEALPDAGSGSVEAAARRATQQAGAEVVRLTSEDGAPSVDVVVLPDGTAFVLSSRLPDAGLRYLLYAVVGDQRVLLGTLHGSGAARLDRIPDGALLVALVDEAGALVAGAPLAGAGAFPPAALPEAPAGEQSTPARPSSTGSASSSPPPPPPDPTQPEPRFAPPPDGSRPPGIDIELPPLPSLELLFPG